MKKWQKIKTLKRYSFGIGDREFYGLDHDQVITPGGADGEYFVIRNSPHSVIIPIRPGGIILLVRQHRYATDEVTLELPMGNSDGGDLLLAARRELEEETGHTGHFAEIGKFQEANGIAEIWGHIFIAHEVVQASNPASDPMDKDLIELCPYTIQYVRKAIAQGEITDASTICAFAIADYQGRFKQFEVIT